MPAVESYLRLTVSLLVSDPTGEYERFAFLYDKRTVISTGSSAKSASTCPQARTEAISSIECTIARPSKRAASWRPKGSGCLPQLDRLKTNFARDATYDKIAWVDRPSFSFSEWYDHLPI